MGAVGTFKLRLTLKKCGIDFMVKIGEFDAKWKRNSTGAMRTVGGMLLKIL